MKHHRRPGKMITQGFVWLVLFFALMGCVEGKTPSQKNLSGGNGTEQTVAVTSVPVEEETTVFSLQEIPAYSGTPYTEVNGNQPYFTEADLTTQSFETYSELDSLGRCGVAYANVGQDLMPTEPRGEIGSVRPTGWHLVKYDNVDEKYLYNRCHLIAYMLTAENANPQNLITGTKYLNTRGMLPFETKVADYVKSTGNHVLYRVTPVFEGDNLLANGVLMEAYSVEDAGEGICFCIFAYNVQPGIGIDYATGDNWAEDSTVPPENTDPIAQEATAPQPDNTTQIIQESSAPHQTQETTYVLNTGTMRFHDPSCTSVGEMKEKNKQIYTGNREDIIQMGYVPCKQCNP